MPAGLPFWQWYGTRFAWTVIGDDYCPFCQGPAVAAAIFWLHAAVPALASWAILSFALGVVWWPWVVAPVIISGVTIGVFASHGFLDHLHGWQEETREMVDEVAAEHDVEVVEIGGDSDV